MLRKSLSIAFGTCFLSVMLMSLWQYCGPHDAKTIKKVNVGILEGIQLNKIHHICPGLDEANVTASLRIIRSTASESFVKQGQPAIIKLTLNDPLRSSFSPSPAINSPPDHIPLFLLIENIRI